MIVKLIQNLEIKMESQINSLEARIEKMQERFNKDLEEIKKSQYIMNNAISEIKNTLEATNSRITEAEDRISEFEDRMVEINESERKKEKRIKSIYLIKSIIIKLTGLLTNQSFLHLITMENNLKR